MELLWPTSLFLLALAPLLVALYGWMLRRRRRYAVRYSSLSLVREALSPYTSWRRHLPFLLFLLALIALTLAFARPQATVQVPTNQTTIILSIDVSRSMCSTDITPNRLAAAQDAALEFIARQPGDTRIGIVAFAGFAQLVQPPTTDRAALEAAIDGLRTSRRTAIGSGILAAIATLAEGNPKIPRLDSPPPTPAPPGSYVPEIIVLLTDGVSMTGPLPLDAAEEAAARGIRVYTIGFGTENGSGAPMVCEGQPLGGGPFFDRQFGGGGGGNFRRGIDEETLQAVADRTGGAYYAAASADELQQVFRSLPITITLLTEFIEISAIFVAAGALLALLAILLAMRWQPLV